MTHPPSPNIPRCPRRDEIGPLTRQVLVRGGFGKADVVVVGSARDVVVVKDFARSAFWLRWVGRLQIRREIAAYEWLEGVPGVPAFVGRVDPDALAIEKIDGERLAFARLRPEDGLAHVAKLRRIVDAIHARGVVHNDLRGHDNVLLGRDGELTVVDFAAAIRMRPGGIAHRLFFRVLSLPDEAALLKWKGLIAPGSYTPADEVFLRRFERWRAIWPFNSKRRKAKSRVA